LYAGYGQFWDGERQISTHRYAYLQWKGEIPHGAMVCHTCDNPPCCNPNHLFLGTHQDNMDDGKTKKRFKSLHGSLHGNAKINEHDVKSIKEQRAMGLTQKQIGKQFGIDQSEVSNILSGKRWHHVAES